MSSNEIIKLLIANGWYEVSQRGSHKQFEHSLNKNKITIPAKKKDLPKGTENSILKKAGLK